MSPRPVKFVALAIVTVIGAAFWVSRRKRREPKIRCEPKIRKPIEIVTTSARTLNKQLPKARFAKLSIRAEPFREREGGCEIVGVSARELVTNAAFNEQHPCWKKIGRLMRAHTLLVFRGDTARADGEASDDAPLSPAQHGRSALHCIALAWHYYASARPPHQPSPSTLGRQLV